MSEFRRNLPFQTVALLELRDCVGNAEVGGENAGPMVEVYQRLSGINEGQDPWCAAAVYWASLSAQAKKNERSPLRDVPLKGYVQSYVQWAREEGLIVEDPAEVGVGDLFALHYPWLNDGEGRYGHIGFVEQPHHKGDSARFDTVEGNTTVDHPETLDREEAQEDREGDMVARKVRAYDRLEPVFIRWNR